MLGYALVAGAACLWGTWALWLRLSGVGPVVQALVVMATLALCGLPIALCTGPARVARPRGAWWAMALLGSFDAANNALFFGAFAQGGVAVAVLSHYLAPVLVTLLAARVLGERLGRRTPWAVGTALVGLTLLLQPWRAGAPLVTAVLGAGSALFYASSVLCAKRLAAWFTPAEITSYHAFVSAALLAPAIALFPEAAPPAGVALVAAAATVLGLGAGIAFYAGLRRVPASHAGVLTYLEPLVAVVVGAIFFAERLGPGALLGGVLILFAGAAVVTERAAR